ncbi:MAG: N-acetylmuramoyl-L-alanine amidase [Bryobacteraceae bacterium]
MRSRQEEGGGMLRGMLLLAVALPVCTAGGQQEIKAVRFWSLGNTTRIAVETDGPVEYRAGRLSNPDRIFFDLRGTLPPREHRKTVQVIPVDDGVLKQIRVALTRPGVTRIVLDLAGAVEFSASQLANPDRLMIEVRALGRAGPLSQASDRAAAPARQEARPREQVVAGKSPGVGKALEKELAPAAEPATPRGGDEVPMGPPPTLGAGPLPLSGPVVAGAPSPGAPGATKPAAEVPVASAPVGVATPKGTASAAVARSAQRDSRGSRSLIRALGLKVGKIVLDPGHGGHDTGSIGPGGLKEKDLVLDIALRLGQLISERMGAEVVYTRTEDTYVPLEARTELANQAKGDLFLSIHANSSRLRSAAGPETFYLNFTTDPSALEVAARENAPSRRSIHELQDLVQKIAQREKVQESREFAGSVQKALWSGLRSGKNRGVKKAPFVVLVGAQMPAVLVEVAFLSNPREERLLKQPEYRQHLAEALYRGLFQYASTLSHFQVARGVVAP